MVVVMGVGVASMSAMGCASRNRRDPEQAQVQYQLGVEYYRGHRVEAALEELDKALKADPDNADAYYMMGIIYLNQGHDYVQQAEVAECLKGNDEGMVRGDATRRFKQAQVAFTRATELRTDFSAAWNNLSVTHLQLQEWEAASAAAQNALKDPTYPDPEIARANLGWAYFQKKELSRAWKELHEAVARSPGFCVGHYRLAKVYVERGDVELAAQEVDAVVTNKTCPIQDAFLLAGLVHQRLKDPERARSMFERCWQMAPRSCSAAECRRYEQLTQ